MYFVASIRDTFITVNSWLQQYGFSFQRWGVSDSLAREGDVDIVIAKKQHEAYCGLLREIGIDVIELPPDDNLPQGVFVENAAVICNGVALIGKSTCPTRQLEATTLGIVLKKELGIPVTNIDDPVAQLDGGDVLFTGREFFVGISSFTNEEGAKYVAMTFPEYPVTPIKVSGNKRLKYYVTMAGTDVLCVSSSKDCQEIVKRMERGASCTYRIITLPEESAANMIYLNGVLIHKSPTEIPDSYRVIKEKIDIPTRNINISELSKLSSGLSSLCILIKKSKFVKSL